MKNQFPKAVLFLSACSLWISSCQKFDFGRHHEEESVQTSTVETTVASGETLSYVLPATMTAETPVISTNTTNAKNSLLAVDATTNQWTYTYTPADGFVGTDQVVIDSKAEKTSTGKKGHGKCGGQDKTKYRLVLKITAQASVADVIKK